MPSNTVVEEGQIQNGVEHSDDDDEVGETGKTDDPSAALVKKKRKKKKKSKGTLHHFLKQQTFPLQNILAQTATNEENAEAEPVSNQTEAIAALSIQQDGIDPFICIYFITYLYVDDDKEEEGDETKSTTKKKNKKKKKRVYYFILIC